MAAKSVQVFNSKYRYTVQPSTLGSFHPQQKFRFEISEILRAKWNRSLQKLNPKIAYIPVAKTQPKPPRVWLLLLWAGYKRAVLGTSTLSNEKGHFSSTIWNDLTGQSGPPSKLVLNVPVRPNWFVPYNVPTEIFQNFGLNGKHPLFSFLKTLACFDSCHSKIKQLEKDSRLSKANY